jgi:DNA repair photolyase
MKRWGKLNPVRFDEKELKTDLGKDNFIFVGSSCDMFADDIPEMWIEKTLLICDNFTENKYLFQTKNPKNIRRILAHESIVCITIESDIYYKDVMKNSPMPLLRFEESKYIRHPLYITIEPIMDFNIDLFHLHLKDLNPVQINIGADSGNNNLPEPPKEKILELISELEKFTKVKQKSNLKRLLI